MHPTAAVPQVEKRATLNDRIMQQVGYLNELIHDAEIFLARVRGAAPEAAQTRPTLLTGANPAQPTLVYSVDTLEQAVERLRTVVRELPNIA